ncbi:neuroligin-2b [Lates japonicus]|uniref:Neuroligin-2b n=1 Tax=Lates japonicus TaxID=270547 RepID=A0AAD3RLC3_LATJO|nr:neuroligin-2b [Lates japonicus]
MAELVDCPRRKRASGTGGPRHPAWVSHITSLGPVVDGDVVPDDPRSPRSRSGTKPTPEPGEFLNHILLGVNQGEGPVCWMTVKEKMEYQQHHSTHTISNFVDNLYGYPDASDPILNL